MRLNPDDRRLELLGQRPQHAARADRPRRQRDERGKVRVEAPHAGLPVRLLRARVAREAPLDQEPRHAVHEHQRAGACGRGQHVVARPARIVDAEETREHVVQNLARPEQRRRDAYGDGDEALQRAKGRMPIFGDVVHRDGPRVEAPQQSAGQRRARVGGQVGVLVDRAHDELCPPELQQHRPAGENRQQTEEKSRVHVPAAQR